MSMYKRKPDIIIKNGTVVDGTGAPAYYADINVFNIHDLKINATFADPCRFSSGMDYVLINGRPVIAKGVHTKERSGRVLRHLPVE